MPARRDPDRVDWVASVPFLLVHAAAVAAPFVAPPTAGLAALAAGLYLVRMFGITAGYHRYFAHRSYRTGRTFQLVLAFLGGMSAQKGALWWASNHREHHRWSDAPEDPHSPIRRGFWWSHVGWFLVRRYDRTRLERIADLTRFPELCWLDRWHLVPPLALGTGLVLLGGLPAFLWGFCVSTVLLWHGTFLINSLAHVLGGRRYETGDESRNSLALALITLGEGWHNNHHFFASTANQGWFWWEVDLTYAVLRLLRGAGVVRDLRTPPPHVKYAHLRPDTAVPAEARPASAGEVA